MRKTRHCFGCLQTLNNWNECQKIGYGKMLDKANLAYEIRNGKARAFLCKNSSAYGYSLHGKAVIILYMCILGSDLVQVFFPARH